MKRNIIVEKLIKEGLSETTLSKLTDKQIGQLAQRMLGEQSPTLNIPKDKKDQVIKAQQGKQTFVTYESEGQVSEKLKGKQKNIDKNHNGKIDAEDFKILKGQKKEVKEWVNNLAESNLYHSFTSKNEIMELIQTKLNESETMTHKFGPKVN